jgi:hypothetical protein
LQDLKNDGSGEMKHTQLGNSKVWMLVVSLIVVAGIVLYMGGVYPPPEEEVRGTIVPAERYRGDQLDSEDIVLGDDTLARFMQTDEFEMLINGAGN